jgi:general secretion pathway protein F
VKGSVKKMLSLLEPALILIMGLVVGFIVISMLLAIFSLNDLPF